jgi:hypothetical protein
MHKKKNNKKGPPNLLFFYLKLCAKFQNPRTTCSGRKVCGGEKRKENRKKIPNIADTLFCSNAQGQRKHSARTKIKIWEKSNRHAFLSCILSPEY